MAGERGISPAFGREGVSDVVWMEMVVSSGCAGWVCRIEEGQAYLRKEGIDFVV